MEEHFSKSENRENLHPSYIVIKFNRKSKSETAHWLVEKLTKEKKKGGAELLLRCHPLSDCSVSSFNIINKFYVFILVS